MPIQLTVRDETASGKATYETVLELMTEKITVEELIRSRVFQEVREYNMKQPEYFRGLVQPGETEQTLNGYRFRQRQKKQIDWEAQFAAALDAFQNNGFFILVDDMQVESLQQEITITPETSVSFLKLVPLVGG